MNSCERNNETQLSQRVLLMVCARPKTELWEVRLPATKVTKVRVRSESTLEKMLWWNEWRLGWHRSMNWCMLWMTIDVWLWMESDQGHMIMIGLGYLQYERDIVYQTDPVTFFPSSGNVVPTFKNSTNLMELLWVVLQTIKGSKSYC